jgi:MinD superfamily P-loop ATPase
LAVEVAREVRASRGMLLPVGVVVNRDGAGDQSVDEYCATAGVAILMHIPHERCIAEAYSSAASLVEALSEYRGRFVALWKRLAHLS